MIIEALKAFLIGVVEGITEWLPVSSTGHMILVDEFIKLQVSPEFLELFFVVIQLGAIMAVLILYFHKLNPFSPKKNETEKRSTWRLWGMVVIGCIPAAIAGFALDDWFNEHFYNAVTVAAALIVYGIIFIVIELYNKRKAPPVTTEAFRGKHARPETTDLDIDEPRYKINSVDEIDVKTALKIGAFQMLAIVPGTSRSGSTIIGGLLSGCSRVAASEFSFFLAIPVMFGWGLLKTVKYVAGIGFTMSPNEIMVLAIGIVTAFVVSVASIKFLIGFVKNHTFIPFGVYRIIVGIVVLAYFVLNGDLFY